MKQHASVKATVEIIKTLSYSGLMKSAKYVQCFDCSNKCFDFKYRTFPVRCRHTQIGLVHKYVN